MKEWKYSCKIVLRIFIFDFKLYIFAENDNSQVLSDNLYYSFSTKANAIFVRELWEYINLAKLDNCEKIYQEFQVIFVR